MRGAAKKAAIEGASEELERRSQHLSSLIQRTRMMIDAGEYKKEVVEVAIKPERRALQQHERCPEPQLMKLEEEGEEEEEKKSVQDPPPGQLLQHQPPPNVKVRAADMPLALRKRAFRCASEMIASMPKRENKRLALALKKPRNQVEIANKIGKKASQKLCNEALFFVGLGSNDYINNFLQPILADGHAYTLSEFEDLLINTLEGQLMRLYKLGARKLVFHGLAPMGCIPSQRAQASDGKCLGYVNDYVQRFNSRVKSLLSGLNSRLAGAQMANADCYDIVLDLVNRPEKYGFKISHTSCCNVDTTVGGLCLPNSNLCSNRADYVFWDAYHPTDAANEVIANKLFADPDIGQAPPGIGLAPSPSPSPL